VASGAHLYLTGNSYLRGEGELIGDGDITITGDDSELQWSGGLIDGNGLFTLEENTLLVIDTSSEVYPGVSLGRSMVNNGQVTVNDGELYLHGAIEGDGTFTISDGTYLSFEEGNYNIGGDFVNCGEVSIWDDASVKFSVDYRQEDTGSLALKVWGAGSSEYCKLEVTGDAYLGGDLEIDFISPSPEEDYTPQLVDSYEIVTCGSRIGEFSSIINNMEGEGIYLVPTYTDTGLILTVSDTPAPGEYMCEVIDETGDSTAYRTLDEALAEIQEGETKTIRLLKDIEYRSGIVVRNKIITFDLNGYNLTVINDTEGDIHEEISGLYVYDDDVYGDTAVNLVGEGEFNVAGKYGIFAEREFGSEVLFPVTVTNATGNGRDAVVAQGAIVTVKGDITVNRDEINDGNNYSGVRANDCAEVIVEGDIHANGDWLMDGICAYDFSSVEVKGSIFINGSESAGVNEGIGVEAYEESSVTVKGNISVTGSKSRGVYACEGSIVTVEGNISVMGSESKGVMAECIGEVAVEGNITVSGDEESIGVLLIDTEDEPSFVTINGEITAPRYIIIDSVGKLLSEFNPDDGYYFEEVSENYLFHYGFWSSCVYVLAYKGGNGTEENPYLIANATQLNAIRALSQWGTYYHYSLVNDIDLGGWYSLGNGWDPIGNSEVLFTGVLDGNGHTIRNLTIFRRETNNIGLFVGIGAGSVIRNVKFESVNITGKRYVGALAGVNFGLVTDCYAKGIVKGTGEYVGGLIGSNEVYRYYDYENDDYITYTGEISNSYFEGEVQGVGFTGGLAGYNYNADITDCYAIATVKINEEESSSGYGFGGLAGCNSGQITGSYAHCTVTGDEAVGGLVGETSDDESAILNSYANGSVTGSSMVGGLAGHSTSSILDSYFIGTVTGSGDSGDYTGGLVGENNGLINACNANATVTSTGNYVGGLAGSAGDIWWSYSVGSVKGKEYVGGLVGESGDIFACYSECTVEGESYVGGLAGYNSFYIEESYAKGSVTGTGEDGFGGACVGGLAGKNTGTIENCYAWGDVSGHLYVGGLVGYNDASVIDGANVINCYEIGCVDSDDEGQFVGPLIGFHNGSTDYIVASFWNSNTSGHTDENNYGIRSNSLDMKSRDTYYFEDWDFDKVWDIDHEHPLYNDGYPFLRWQIGEFAGGSGTEEDPYLVANAEQLNNVRNYLDKHFLQIDNINLSSYSSGQGWEPIGTMANPFTGSFDGGGYTISNLFIERNDYYTGLFGYISYGGEVSNVNLEAINVTSSSYYVGGLVGKSYGTIDNCSVTGNISVYGWFYPVGGLAGENCGTITCCSFDGLVSGEDDYCGGLVGRDEGTIISCHTKGTVKGEDMVGGLVGYKVKNSGIIKNSYSECYVEGDSNQIGGLVGNNDGMLEGCFALGNVKGTNQVGGLVGYNYRPGGIINNCYALGSAEGHDYIGGLAGVNSNSITNCYSTGKVTDNTVGENAGGLVGTATENGIVVNSYWDSSTSSQSSSAGGEGKTTAQMKQGTTFENWDFITVWDIDTSFNDGYPFLRWQWDTPPVLSGTGVDSVTASTATLSFTSSKSGTYYYLVYYAAESPPDTDTIKAQGEGAAARGTGIAEAGTNTVTVTDLMTKTAYNAYIIVEYSEGNISNIAVINFDTGSVITVPSAPQNFTATPGDGQVTLSWAAPEDDGGAVISRYEVSSDNGANWTNVGLNTSYTFTDLTNSTEYTFKVRAVNSKGNGEESAVSATPAAAPVSTYTVTVTNGTGSGQYAEGVTVSISLYFAPDGQQFKEWQVISGGVTLEDSKAPSTSFIMPANDVEITAVYEEVPVTTYTVTINGSYAATTGAGSYEQGDTVTINAGSRANYSFSSWTSSDGVTFANPNSATTTFIMPAKNVTVRANWTYIYDEDDDEEDTGDSTPSAPESTPPPAYAANVKTGQGTEMTVPVAVDKDTGTASADMDSGRLTEHSVIITIPSIPDIGAYSVGIPVPDLSTIDAQRTFTLHTETGSVTVPSNMLTGIAVPEGDKAQIIISHGDKSNLPDDIRDAIGDRPLVQLTLAIDGNQTDWNNPDAPVTVTIPYTPTAEELANPESIVVWYIDGSGNVISVPNGRYDPESGTVTFTTSHFSYYAVSYKQVSFKDVAKDAWYAKAVSFIAARDITTGTGDGNFSPEAKLTRGQFIVMIMRAYGIAPDTNPEDNFADGGNTWYTGYLAAAKRLKISAGVGNNMFAPDREITRQEMFTLLYNALKVTGQLPTGTSGKTLPDFSDAGDIAPWAKDAMKLLVETGIVSGSGNRLSPKDTTTRAQMAQVLYNLLSK
jgi:uncharacterized repeat protein (TIGR02543 family)